ncbi:MAG: PAS domain-containing protein [Nitrospirae bacterium]|nr:PAS domain-containing protein [Nitrospirota bacterium]
MDAGNKKRQRTKSQSRQSPGHAESELIESEKRFRAVATSTTDLIWEGDVRHNILKWFGDIDSCLGYGPGEFPRTVTGHMENVHPEDRDRFQKSVESALRTGNDFHAAYRMRCKDGSYCHWEERGKAVGHEKGKAVKWVGAVTDITARKQAEEKLTRSKEQYKRLSQEFHALLDAISDDIILLGRDMSVIWANQAFASRFGRSAAEISGEYCHTLCCRLSSPCKNCPVEESFKSGREESARVLNPEGKILDKRAFPILDGSGKTIKAIEVTRDITAGVRMEEEARRIQSQLIHANKMTSLGALVSGVAHEINNPNSFIHHNAQTLNKIWQDALSILGQYYQDKGSFKLAGISYPKLQALVPELMNGINEGSLRIRKFVENLRNFARPEITCMREEVSVNNVVMTSISILNNQIRKFTDNFYVDCSDDVPLIRGSAQQIEQVIINIIINALQSLPDKKSGVRVLTSYDEQSMHVVIKVQDDGTGISDDILGQITEPFFTTKSGSGGTGLGLSISETIIKAHDGSLTFKSEVGRGTTVSIKLPVKAQ